MNKRRENESQLRLAGIVESAMDAIVTIDGRHRIVLFNPAAEAMFGVPAAEVLGHPLSRFVPPKYRDRHDDFIKRFRDAGATTRRMGALGAVSAQRGDGEEFPAEASRLRAYPTRRSQRLRHTLLQARKGARKMNDRLRQRRLGVWSNAQVARGAEGPGAT